MKHQKWAAFVFFKSGKLSRILAACVALVIFTSFAGASITRGNHSQQTWNNSSTDAQPPVNDAKTLLASAHTIYVNSQSAFVKNKAMISALNDHKELRDYGLAVTDSASSADLMLSIDRAPFTIEYSFTVIHQRSRIVVASGHVNSLFGTVPGKVASSFAKQLKAAHQPAKGK
jgi:hypothetical protein